MDIRTLIDRQRDGQMHGQTDGRTDKTDRRTDIWTDGQMGEKERTKYEWEARINRQNTIGREGISIVISQYLHMTEMRKSLEKNEKNRKAQRPLFH